MRYLQRGVVGVLVIIVLNLNVVVHGSAPTITLGSGALAHAENGTKTNRFTHWTRAGFEAAKKHWAEDQQRFWECSNELDDAKKKNRRMSYHRQGHFLEKCMQEKR
jgi:hypothetical protein